MIAVRGLKKIAQHFSSTKSNVNCEFNHYSVNLLPEWGEINTFSQKLTNFCHQQASPLITAKGIKVNKNKILMEGKKKNGMGKKKEYTIYYPSHEFFKPYFFTESK